MKNVLKILGLLTLVAILVIGCKKKEEPQPPTVVEDGYYLAGKAIFSEELKQSNLLEDGWIDKYPDPSAKSEGLMVKFVYVKAGTDGFTLKQQAGQTLYVYGLDGAWQPDTARDWAWTGTIKKDGTPFTVQTDGLYFFIVDIPSMKAAILKVNSWEIVGNMTNWGFDSNFVFTQKSLSLEKGEWEFKDFTLKPGKEFKVRINALWNYTIAEGKNVQTNVGMGADLTKLQYGGANFTVGSEANQIPAGIYTLVVKWDFSTGITLTRTKTADVTYTDWSTTKIEIVGNGVSADNPNAISDAGIWNWNVYLYAMGGTESGLYYEKNGNVYKWKWTNVKLLADQGFKVRCHEGDNSFDGGNDIVDFNNSSSNVAPGTGNSDIKVTVEGQYDLELIIDAENGDSKTLTIKEHTI